MKKLFPALRSTWHHNKALCNLSLTRLAAPALCPSGEYGIYCDGKMVALVCDEKLFVKPTSAGRAYIGDVTEGVPYQGAKSCFLITGEKWDEGDWLTELIRVSTAALPIPSKKRKAK